MLHHNLILVISGFKLNLHMNCSTLFMEVMSVHAMSHFNPLDSSPYNQQLFEPIGFLDWVNKVAYFM